MVACHRAEIVQLLDELMPGRNERLFELDDLEKTKSFVDELSGKEASVPVLDVVAKSARQEIGPEKMKCMYGLPPYFKTKELLRDYRDPQ